MHHKLFSAEDSDPTGELTTHSQTPNRLGGNTTSPFATPRRHSHVIDIVRTLAHQMQILHLSLLYKRKMQTFIYAHYEELSVDLLTELRSGADRNSWERAPLTGKCKVVRQA